MRACVSGVLCVFCELCVRLCCGVSGCCCDPFCSFYEFALILRLDVYSFGVTAWETMSGCVPYKEGGFGDAGIGALAVAVMQKRLRPSPPVAHSVCQQLIERSWHQDAHERPTFLQLVKWLHQIAKGQTPDIALAPQTPTQQQSSSPAIKRSPQVTTMCVALVSLFSFFCPQEVSSGDDSVCVRCVRCAVCVCVCGLCFVSFRFSLYYAQEKHTHGERAKLLPNT